MLMSLLVTRARMVARLDNLDTYLSEPVDTSDYRLLLNGAPMVCNTDYLIEVFFILLGRIGVSDTLTIVDGRGEELYNSDEFRSDPYISIFMKPGRG